MKDLEQGSRHWELVYQRLKYWSASLSDFSAPPAMEKHQTYMQENFVLTIWLFEQTFVMIHFLLLFNIGDWNSKTQLQSSLFLQNKTLLSPPRSTTLWTRELKSREKKNSSFLVETLPLGPDCPAVTFVRLRFCSWYFFFVSYFIFNCQGLKNKLFAKIWFWYAVPLS